MSDNESRPAPGAGPAPAQVPAAPATPPGGRWDRLRIRHGREILHLAIPTVLAMLSHTLMWTVDTALLGHASSLALAAAGLGGIITWALYSVFNNLNRIPGTFVAQAHGRGDDPAVGDYTWQGIWVALATGLLLQAAGWFSDRLLPWTRNPADVQALTYVYIKWRTLSAVFTQLGFCLSGFFQGRRDVKTPMWAGIAGNAVNVVLDVWLIFGWSGLPLGGRRLLAVAPLGVQGAAIATSIGTLVTAAVLAARLFLPREHRDRYRIHRPRRPAWRPLRNLVRVGMPASWEGFIDMSAFVLFSSFVGRAGAVGLAASQITIQLLSFSFMPMWGIATAGSVLTGNWLGAGRPDRAAAYGRQVYKMGLAYVLLVAIVLLAARPLVFRVFTDDPAVLALSAGLVLIAAVFQVCDGLRMVAVGILQGAGDTRYPMLQSLLVLWGLWVPLTWLLVVHLGRGLHTAWWGGTFCYLLQALFLYARFRSGRWQDARIFGAPPQV